MTMTHQEDRHETDRAELAELLEREPSDIVDDARLTDDLSLDSLAMMSLLAWLEGRGVVIADDRRRPATVGEVLELLDRPAAFPGLSIKIGGVRQLDGPADLPALPFSGSPLAPVLASGAFELTPVQPDDYGFLYRLSSQPETCFRWRYRGAPPAYDRFAADLWSRVLVQFVVRRADTSEPVGLVVAYAADAEMRHTYLGAVFVPRHTGNGLAAQAVSGFVRYLFHTFPLHKIYLEVPGYNWSQLESGSGRLFEVEGLLKEHEYYAGRYWDKRICAIYRGHAERTSVPG